MSTALDRPAQPGAVAPHGRVPPHNLDAERSLLGGILLDSQGFAEVVELVKADEFYRDSHRKVFEAMSTLFGSSQPIDRITVKDQLTAMGAFESVGGDEFIDLLDKIVPTAANLAWYARIIHDKALARRLIEAASAIAQLGYDQHGDVGEFADECERRIFSVTEARTTTGFVQLKPIIAATFKTIESLFERQEEITGIPTGFADLDRMTSGFQPGDLVILAARPSMGKAQPLDAPVLTPQGFVPMGQIQPGSLVIGQDGKPHRVQAVFPQGEKEVYRVRFSDGAVVECCDEHLWFTTTRAESQGPSGSGSVKALAEIRRTLLLKNGSLNHRIPMVEPVQFAPRPAPAERAYELASRLSRAKPPEVAIDGLRMWASATGETSIPDDYLYGDVSVRLELLRGFFDSTGRVMDAGNHCIEFLAPTPLIAEQISFVARSLGATAKPGKRPGLMLLWFPRNLVPVTAGKHLERWNTESDRYVGRFIESVELAGKRPCQCILVDSDDHLYVTSDFVVTHNTACCLNIATHVGVRGKYQGKRCGVGIFSLEMPKEQLVMRMLASEARVDSQRIRTGKLIESDWAKLAQAAGVLAEANIHIDDTPAVSALELRAKCRRLFAKYENTDQPLRMIVVDYLQLMRGNERIDSREQQISEISRSLKALAKELGIPVMALSQLNRSLEKRPDKRPMMSDLRESGAIEQDADTIMFIYREEVYEKEKEDVKGIAELIIGKQRNGPIGTANLAFVHEHTRFENLARDYVPSGGE